MSRHLYPTEALIGDYGRAAGGLALVGLPLVALDLSVWLVAIFAALAVLFAAFGLRTVLRQASPVEMDEEAIASGGPFPTRIPWSALNELKLGYYTTRRDGKNGWMQLALAGGGKKLNLDSRITNFDGIVRRAALAAEANGIPVGITTAANFAALGFELAPR
jgi:hypothetical protein